MPIRIKPVQNFGPCILTLESIEKIIARVEKDLPLARYTAVDGAWEVYDEPKLGFLSAIKDHKTLDSFIVHAQTNSNQSSREIEIVFNDQEAKLNCKAQPEEEDWFEHFLIDFKKYILPPSAAQLIAHVYGRGQFDFRFLFLVIPISPSQILSTPYCNIVILQKPPNPFVENIKANLVSNVIWAIVIFALGVGATFITQSLLGK